MNIIVLELILVAVVALGLGFWQLYDVNKALKKDRPEPQGEKACSRTEPRSGDKSRADHRG